MGGGNAHRGRVIRTYLKTSGAVFDPETVTILAGAFDDAWSSIEVSGAQYSGVKYVVARQILAQHIIAAAKGGERNQQVLTEGALFQLSRSSLSKPSK